MELASVKHAMPVYQGSGLESSANQKKVEVVTTEAPAQAAPAPKEWKPVTTDPKSDSEKKVTEIQDANRNDSVKRAVEQINRKAKNSEAIFGIHEDTNRVIIKIVDKETKEVLKEFPPEQTLDMIAKVWELAGLLVDEKR